MLNHAQNPEIAVTPRKPRFTCGFPCAGAVGQISEKSFFENRGNWGGKTPIVHKTLAFLYITRAAQGLLMGRAATFSQLKVPIGFCHGDPTPITFWLHYLLPIDFRSIKRLASDFLKAQVSELRTFSSPNKPSLGSSNSIGNEIGEVA